MEFQLKNKVIPCKILGNTWEIIGIDIFTLMMVISFVL